jgi:uncharacterized protein
MKNVALITGASSGIGKDLAKIHASQKGDLVIIARRTDKLESLKNELIKEFGVEVYIITKDLSLPNSCEEVYNEIKDQKIEVDYLINNAGFGGVGLFHERDWSQDVQMIDLNIKALTDLTRRFLPDFVKRKHGKVLNIGSTAAFIPGPLQAVYFASKAYVRSFSLAIASELSDTGVTVTVLLPGATETEFGDVSGMGKTALFNTTACSQKVAKEGYDAMIKGELEKISGLTFVQKVMMAFVPFTPMKMILKQVKTMQKTIK